MAEAVRRRFVASLGACVVILIASVPLGRAIGRAIGEAIAEGIGPVLARCVPPGFTPDLAIAPGEPGYHDALAMAGRQLHFHDKERTVTRIAVEAWLDDRTVRVITAEYDGPPRTTLPPALLRTLAPVVSMLVVRTRDAPEVRWASGDGPPRGPCSTVEGALNLLVGPGKVAIWTGDGPRHEVDVGWQETVWCTIGAGGLAIERREAR